MPIRFRCNRCHQMLGIASRKAGADIDCPKCGYSQTVPSEEAAAAALAMDQGARSPAVLGSPSDLVVYDDEPAAIETPRPRRRAGASQDNGGSVATGSATEPASGKPSASAAQGDEPAPAAAPEPAPAPGEPVPRGMILFPRHVFYVQGVLFLVLGAMAFAAGYFMGRGDVRFEQQAALEEASKERTPVEGTLTHRPGPNQVEPDERAVVVVLPADKLPEKPLIADGIRPSDPNPLKSHPSIRAINELGGAYVRADEKGSFYTVLPDKGEFWVLVISAHAARKKNVEIAEPDLEELGKYFSQPELLISRYKYRFTKETIDSGFNPIEIDFDLEKES